jgi:hypothetical protein
VRCYGQQLVKFINNLRFIKDAQLTQLIRLGVAIPSEFLPPAGTAADRPVFVAFVP